MSLKNWLYNTLQRVLQEDFGVENQVLELQQTRSEFEGDYTLLVFPLVRQIKGRPEEVAERIGEKLVQRDGIDAYNVIKGFLNISLSNSEFTHHFLQGKFFDFHQPEPQKWMVEYSSPNTNKPLHLGHIRNILLGYSVAQIQKAAGHEVLMAQVVNDRGIHICKSMLAWQQFGENETPESSGLKGDKLVGKYYVRFDQENKKQIEQAVNAGQNREEAEKSTALLQSARDMLVQWEEKDPTVRKIWEKMNNWVFQGFNATYDRLGVQFDVEQYESNTYLLGKEMVEVGLEKGIFYREEDGSVWIDLSDEGLDKKIILRSDGTSVYITQDIGTAIERFEKYELDGLTYVVGNEQDYHFKVLFIILQKLGYKWSHRLNHLSYGMVDLPHGKMKSREGTVVDADDLMDEMHATARDIAFEAGKLDEIPSDQRDVLYEKIGLGALKYFILKVDPRKRILFDPRESIDFNGNTGPFIQYTYVRILSILRRNAAPEDWKVQNYEWEKAEKDIVLHLNDYNTMLNKASQEWSPALVANYLYDLVRLYNSFYQNHSVLQANTEEQKNIRLHLTAFTASCIEKCAAMLGMQLPERM
ncbi:MAG: arginine--tRNA ligase [Weeksellaceae bacterium]|nr:arginine--tRNA ligase [Weeksellaceae bacterium]